MQIQINGLKEDHSVCTDSSINPSLTISGFSSVRPTMTGLLQNDSIWKSQFKFHNEENRRLQNQILNKSAYRTSKRVGDRKDKKVVIENQLSHLKNLNNAAVRKSKLNINSSRNATLNYQSIFKNSLDQNQSKEKIKIDYNAEPSDLERDHSRNVSITAIIESRNKMQQVKKMTQSKK